MKKWSKLGLLFLIFSFIISTGFVSALSISVNFSISGTRVDAQTGLMVANLTLTNNGDFVINSNNNSNVIITNMPISGPTFRAYNQDGNISGQPYWNLDIPTAGIQPGSSYKFVDRIRYYSSARTELPSPTFTLSLIHI